MKKIQNEIKESKETELMISWTQVCFLRKATSDNKIFVISLKLHEIKNEIWGEYTGDFQMLGDIVIGEHKQATAMRFKNIEAYESSLKRMIWKKMLMIVHLLVIFIN